MSNPCHKVLVVDLEMTTYEGDFPEGETRDIIEVGFCTWDSALDTISEPISYYVLPERSTVSPYCTELTGLTPQKLSRMGTSLQRVCDLLKMRGSLNKAWAGFGSDASILRAQCREQQCTYPFGESYYDVSSLYTLITGERGGLKTCLKKQGLEWEGTEHRARWDAYNTAKLLRSLLKK